MRLVFDLEANGLYYDASLIHCIVAKDVDTGDLYKFGPDEVEQGLKFLTQADELIGHNVIGYDIPLMSKLYPWFSIPRHKVTDTLVLSRLVFADLSDQDHTQRAQMEGKLIGSHSLRAWGQRLGCLKSDYQGGFEAFSEEMLAYNVQDVEVTERLYHHLLKQDAFSERASVLEHSVAHIVAQQERHGFAFDVKSAEELTALLMIRRAELEQQLQDTFKPWEQDVGEFIPKVNNAKRGYVKGVPIRKTKVIVFNPGSRHHIANRLITLRGWKPKEFTPDGSAKVDEQVLAKLPYPEAQLLSSYFLIQKRLGMLSEGTNAWLKMVKPNGRIHGEVITNGAVTGRATHRNPNVAQTPAVRKDKHKNILFGESGGYGHECRQLFIADKDKVLVGVDVSGLELRMLGHYMSKHDNGEYGREVINGDVHSANQKAAGLQTRDQAKTFIYAFLYGAGPEKIGSIVGEGAKHGKILRERFLKSLPALAELIQGVQFAAGRGHLVGLDGRHLRIRSSHAALNTLLQSAGALVCKQWMVEVDKALTQAQWSHKVQQVAWIHDECQFSCDPDISDQFGELAIDCIRKAGDEFKINVPLSGEYKVGKNWADTH